LIVKKDRLPTTKSQKCVDVDLCKGNCEDMFEGDFLWGLKAFKCNNLANRSVHRVL